MAAILHVMSATKDIKVGLSRAAGQTVEFIIKNRLGRGDEVPLLIEGKSGTEQQHVVIRTVDDYTMDFADDGEPGASADDIAKDLAAADQAISAHGYLRVRA